MKFALVAMPSFATCLTLITIASLASGRQCNPYSSRGSLLLTISSSATQTAVATDTTATSTTVSTAVDTTPTSVLTDATTETTFANAATTTTSISAIAISSTTASTLDISNTDATITTTSSDAVTTTTSISTVTIDSTTASTSITTSSDTDTSSSTPAPPPARTGIIATNSPNTFVNGQELQVAGEARGTLFNPTDSEWHLTSFSLESGTNYLMAKLFYLGYILSTQAVGTYGPPEPQNGDEEEGFETTPTWVYIYCDSLTAGAVLTCHPVGYDSITKFYVDEGQPENILLSMRNPTLDPGQHVPVDLTVGGGGL